MFYIPLTFFGNSTFPLAGIHSLYVCREGRTLDSNGSRSLVRKDEAFLFLPLDTESKEPFFLLTDKPQQFINRL